MMHSISYFNCDKEAPVSGWEGEGQEGRYSSPTAWTGVYDGLCGIEVEAK